MTNTDVWMISLTALIAVAGIISATIFNNQLSVMQGQLDEMKSTGKQNEILIETNKNLADAAKKSANVAERTFTELERPYIFVDTPKFAPSQIEGRPPVIQYILKNYGRTPAIVRWLKAEGRIINPQDPSSEDKAPIWTEIFNGQAVFKTDEEREIQPNARMPIAFPETQSVVQTAVPLLTIEVTYSDVFDYMHVSEFTFFESQGAFHAIAGKKYNRSKSEKLPEDVEWTPAWSEKKRE